MIHAYNDDFLPTIQEKLGSMFEIAVLKKNIPIDDFADRFLNSSVCHAFETADPMLALGKSAIELLSIVLSDTPTAMETDSYASPEYWAGYTLAYMQWYFNKPYSELVAAFPCNELLAHYFPYHEMDIRQSVDLFASKLKPTCALKSLRMAKHLSQRDLSLLSGVPVRNIKAYEQGKVEIGKAQAETLYALSKVLNCSIEDLIL